MRYVQLGRAGLSVSAMALGSWRLGRTPEDEVGPLVHAALDAGVNLIDTAPGYADGRAERWIGDVIRDRGDRDRVLLATKCSAPKPREPNGYMTTRRAILEHVEQSLRRLGVDTIDLYQLHCVERFVPIDETLGALTDLVRQGKVRYLGASNFKGWQLLESLWCAKERGFAGFITDQSEYHLFDRRLERENFPPMQSYGLAALVYSPLGQGLLAGRRWLGHDRLDDDVAALRRERPDHVHWSQPVQAALGQLIELAREHGRSPAQLALAFVMSHPVTAVPITGPRTRGQLDDCLAACDIEVDDALRAAFDAIVKPGEKLVGQAFNAYNHGPTARWW